MKCPVCNFENSDNAKFCQECGLKLEPQLKACTNEECCDYGKCILPPEANFCPRCGHKIERQEIQNEENNTNRTKNKKDESDGFINGHEYVDLGLPYASKWATCNVGADSPEGYGDYFAWGETETPKDDYYSEENCGLYEIDMKDIGGDPDYDIATSEWGEGWRMPTYDEMNILIDFCKWKWIKQKGVNGYKVTGPNGNSIFLPAAGRCYFDDRPDPGKAKELYYWSSTPHTKSGARCLKYKKDKPIDCNYHSRFYGCTVRAVSR